MAEIYPAIVAVNKTYQPPLPPRELKTTFESIVKKELARQREITDSVPSPFQLKEGAKLDLSLRKNGNGVVFKDMANALIVIANHPTTKGRIRYNEFSRDIEWNDGKEVRAWEETDTLSLVYLMQTEIKLAGMTKDAVYDAVRQYAYENRYDEAKEWLASIKWDGVSRLESWLIRATGVVDDQYHRSIGAHWFTGMVRRLLFPGSQFDYVLVIVGPQGIGKTSLFRILGGPWYKSYTGAVENKDFYIALRGACIVDLDEGVALNKSESIKIKSIISEVADEYRAPYDRTTKRYPRRFVFSMSTNDTEPFRDMTGNRRYWTVDVKKQVDFEWLKENRNQLYAEAAHVVKNDVKLIDVPFDIAAQKQDDHLPYDEWTESIAEFILSSEKYCVGDQDFSVSIGEIFDKVLKGDRLERLERKHEMRIGNVLRKEMGLERKRVTMGDRRPYRYALSDERMAKLKGHPLVISKSAFDKEAEEMANSAKL